MMDTVSKEHFLRIDQKTLELIGIPIPGIFPDNPFSGYANYTGYSDPIVYPGLPKLPDSGNRQRSFPVMEVARKPAPDTGEFLYRRIVLSKN